ncbi:MAG TPA: lysophospholipid acyltransferase family protein [Syntrophorhabdus sp.]|nr:lysophospholipid acyltransferase family protein [Syntrophorhabdus sp.]MDI9557773.1 lysophospholipid acyltransferase family protein [Pseudomonadota bacterium]OPX95678.1 MAG: Lipid A biosynthesis lauroyl acyltransferase [Syntrophorhabdus sp. PtaB.Bin027]OQB76264.1 MAG: Lipid A biosynthesis lauroyl acyltransferase [Deltaproteobacteria bacterium ADurb.Bin135]MBP8743818.1 lysophospholipid acyltransferase family protein [Syntrophorhabdus sp.]
MLIDLLLILTIKVFQLSLRILPENYQQGTGAFFGRVAFKILKKRRNVAISNILRAFKHYTEREASEIALRSFEKLGINFVEALLLPYIPTKDYEKRFSIEHRDYMDRALALNKGVIALVFHYANWEIMGIASSFFQNPVVVLARPLKRHRLIDRFMNHMRASTGLTVIPNVNTSRDVMRFLRENKIIAILGDQREKRSKGVYVDFFGESVPTNKGITMIAMKTGTPVMPVYFIRKGFLRYVIRCNEPIEMERKGKIEELIRQNTRKINAFLESIIIENPDEWFWVHRRWGRDKP